MFIALYNLDVQQRTQNSARCESKLSKMYICISIDVRVYFTIDNLASHFVSASNPVPILRTIFAAPLAPIQNGGKLVYILLARLLITIDVVLILLSRF